MSTYRDSLPASQRAALGKAIAAAGQVLKQAQTEMSQSTPEAVARGAWTVTSGIRPAADVAAEYREMQDEERRRAA